MTRRRRARRGSAERSVVIHRIVMQSRDLAIKADASVSWDSFHAVGNMRRRVVGRWGHDLNAVTWMLLPLKCT